MYDTKVFTGPKMLDGKLIYNTEVEYCAYCGCEAIKDEEWDECTQYRYVFCNCDLANLEKKYKELGGNMINGHKEELLLLRQTYKEKGVLI